MSVEEVRTSRFQLPPLYRDRPLAVQIVLGGVLPCVFGALAGVLIGVSAAPYYVLGLVAAIGSVLAGLEHRDGWGGADRGFFGGAIYGAALLIVHGIIGNTATVSLGSFPPLLAVLTAIVGMFLSAAGGRYARLRREKQGIFLATDHETVT